MSVATTAEDRGALERAVRVACDAEAWEDAVTLAVRGYGPELLGYLNALLRDPAEADDVFATTCENLWAGLPRFAWQSTFRTWAYTVTRNACVSFVRGSRKRRTVPLSSAPIAALAAGLRTQTATFLRSETKDRLAEIRAALAPDDQTLLILRIDRQLAWREIAHVFEPEPATPAVLEARAATLRKRFERLKSDLRERLGR